MASETSQKVFVIKLLYILSFYSTRIVSLSGVTPNKTNLDQILTNFIKVDTICFKPEERNFMPERNLIFLAAEMTSQLIIQIYLFWRKIFLFDSEICIRVTEIYSSFQIHMWLHNLWNASCFCERGTDISTTGWVSVFSWDLEETPITTVTDSSHAYHINSSVYQTTKKVMYFVFIKSTFAEGCTVCCMTMWTC